MKDKVFIDTNIFVYSALDDEEEKVKREKAIELLKQFSDKQTIVKYPNFERILQRIA